MRINHWRKLLSAGMFLVAHSTMASISPDHEQYQIPRCLAGKLSVPHQVLAEDREYQIIDLAFRDFSALQQLADKAHCGRFVNLSHRFSGITPKAEAKTAQALLRQSHIKALRAPAAEAYSIKHVKEVQDAIGQVVSDNIWQTLTKFTSFHNRSATKDTGVEAANWLKAQFEAMAVAAGRTDTSTYLVKTGRYKQPSLVTVLGKDIDAPGIVIGAHMDTLDGRMPGAGDDGSGSATVMEMARVLLNSKQEFKRPIYIIWYAAEERGLVGSQYVVKHFKNKNIPVKAAIQFDMTGYRVDRDDPTMWVYTDHTNKSLSQFVARLIETYVKVPVDFSRCGYGCSDHASWDDENIPAAFPCESNFEDHNPYIHSSSDTMDLLSLEHMTNFTKLALAFAIELASE